MAAALLLAVPFIIDKEGESLVAYRDVVGVWTICHGETNGVREGDQATREQCRLLTQSRVGQFMQKVDNLIVPEVKPETLAAHTSFAYNIGLGGYSTSQALKLTNSGYVNQGCHAMMNWNGLTIKGVRYDCNRPENQKKINGCRGLVNRRVDEVKLCMGAI